MAVIEKVNYGPVSGVRIGRFNKGINTSFIVYQYQDVIIDSGPINQWQYVEAFVKQHKVNHALITHYHEDHSGNVFYLKNNCQLSVHSNELCHHKLKQPFDIPFIQKLIWGTGKAVETEVLTDKFTSNENLELELLLTPGHTEDMSCFYDKANGFLFTGDLYIASKVRYFHKDEDLTKQLHSLNKVLTLDFDTAFCPHRGIMKNGKQDITNKRDFILELAEKVKSLAKQGISVKQIQKQLLGKEDLFSLVSKFHFTKQGLIEACLKLPDISTNNNSI